MDKTMQRLKRGDLSRIRPRTAMHTDVFQGTPVAANVQPVAKGKDVEAVAKLQAQVAALTTENKELSLLTHTTEAVDAANAELTKVKEQLGAADARATAAEERVGELEARDPAEAPVVEPVDSVRITNVQQVRVKGNTMRVDFEVEPTEGPLKQTIALYLTVEEGAKLKLDEPEAPAEEPAEEEVKDDDGDEDQ